MSTFPHSRLFIGTTRSVVISGPHIQVLETQTGSVLYSTARLEDAEKEKLLKSGPVRCAAVDAAFVHVVTSGEDKHLKVWEVESLKLVSERELPKKPTDIHLTRDGQTILVSDKFGDVFSYPLHPEPVSEPEPSAEAGSSKRGALTSHENPSNGKLILGHTSLLTTFLLTEDEKYIISADRDEHIRVSWYPQGYIIERYCLGHRKYVSAVHVPSFSPSSLLSGGGDPSIKLWDWMSGDQLADVPIGDVVEKYIKVKAPKARFGRTEDGDDEGQPPSENQGRRKNKKRNGRGKGKQTVQEEGEGEGGEQAAPCGEGETDETFNKTLEETAVSSAREEAEVATEAEEDKLVLALRRIDSLNVPDAGNLVVFSAVGATALFFFKFPSLPATQSEFTIEALDLGKPIMDFTIGDHGCIWVVVDGEHQVAPTPEDAPENKHAVRLVHWQDGKFAEATESSATSLLSSLNTACILPATTADLKTLDVYSALVSLPKNVDADHDPMRRGAYDNMDEDTPDATEEGAGRGGKGRGKGKAREPTQRELARASKMKAVRAKIQEQQQTKNVGERPTPEGEPESKKVKAEGAEDSKGEDVVMSEAS